MAEYEFDAHIVVEGAETKELAAEEILECFLDADIATSLQDQGTLNKGALKDAVIQAVSAYRKARYNASADRAVLWQAVEDALDSASGRQNHGD